MKALVTGGTGFVGSHVARMLVEQGHTVRILHRTSSKLSALEGLAYESAIGGLNDLNALRSACDGVDWVFHVAAVADYWRADQSRMFTANVDGTRTVLQAAREMNVKRVVFTSSAAAIGLQDAKLSDETTPFNYSPDLFPYAYSKVLAEQVVAEAVEQGQDIVTVNPVVVMGPGDLNMISGSFITQIKRFGPLAPVTSGGIAVIDVRDVARGHLAAVEKGISGQRYILGTANYSYREWFDMIADTVGVMRPYIYTPDFLIPILAYIITLLRSIGIQTPVDSTQVLMGVKNIYFDYTKAHNQLGKPQIDMVQSLQDTYNWYRDHGYL